MGKFRNRHYVDTDLEPVMVDDRDYASINPLTREANLEIGRRSVIDHFGEPPRYVYGQLWTIAGDIAARCAAETIQSGEGHGGLNRRLDWAMDFIQSLQSLGRTTKIRDLCWKPSEDLIEDEKRVVERAQRIVWERPGD